MSKTTTRCCKPWTKWHVLLLLCWLTGDFAVAGQSEAQTSPPPTDAPPPTAYQQSAQTRSSVITAAAGAIDWNAVKLYFPIPASMPTASSDDPLGAGFSPEWVKRALRNIGALAAPMDLQRNAVGKPAVQLALSIISERRAPDDLWAYNVERKLREIIRTKVDVEGPTVSRVFCNSVGCLCYMERDGDGANMVGFGATYEPLVSGADWARESGIDPHSVYLVGAGIPPDYPTKGVWQLVYILRQPQK